MNQVRAASIRDVLLQIVRDQEPRNSSDPPLNQNQVLGAAERRLGVGADLDSQQAVLAQWGDLFRSGLLAWGLNLNNPNAPFLHLTERGRRTLANLTRDPANPAGYVRHLRGKGELSPLVASYVDEGLQCYVAGLDKAAAVMIGAATEALVLEVRTAVINRLTRDGSKVHSELRSNKVRTVTRAVQHYVEGCRDQLPRSVVETFEAYWGAFAQQIRAVRNDAGHPANADQITPDAVHASYLVFPEMLALAVALNKWCAS